MVDANKNATGAATQVASGSGSGLTLDTVGTGKVATVSVVDGGTANHANKSGAVTPTTATGSGSASTLNVTSSTTTNTPSTVLSRL